MACNFWQNPNMQIVPEGSGYQCSPYQSLAGCGKDQGKKNGDAFTAVSSSNIQEPLALLQCCSSSISEDLMSMN